MPSPIKHVFVVMMENRSFDHMLGHRHAVDPKVDGIRKDDATWLAKVANPHGGTPWKPHPLLDPHETIAADPPHGRDTIANQLDLRAAGFTMKGFVTSYARAKEKPVIDALHQPPVMGWFGAAQAPVSDWLAANFAVCDRWFAPLPAGTQPNRLMAMSGATRIDRNHAPIPKQKLVYDWLRDNDIRWRVYHHGVPFFALMPKWLDEILTSKHFRGFGRFDDDLVEKGPERFPQVVFLEPTYADGDVFGRSNDDHAPEGIVRGQRFLWKIYRALEAAPEIFAASVLVVTYDEHGGFFDHVAPPPIATKPPANHKWRDSTPFRSLGVRVPALVVSPLVAPGTVYSEDLDHVSVLKLIGSVFGGGSYSTEVDARPVGNVLEVLDLASPPRPIPRIPDFAEYFLQPQRPPPGAPAAPRTVMQAAFRSAIEDIRKHPGRRPGEFEELLAVVPAGPPPAAGVVLDDE